jgi:hypothetical protein
LGESRCQRIPRWQVVDGLSFVSPLSWAGEALVREVVGSLCCKRVTVAATTRCGCRWERARFKQDGIGVEQRARVAQVMRAFRIFRMLVVLARPKGSVQYLGRHDVPTVPYCTCWSLAPFETKPDLRKPSPQSSTGTFSPRQSTNGPILSASTKPSNRPTVPPSNGRPKQDCGHSQTRCASLALVVPAVEATTHHSEERLPVPYKYLTSNHNLPLLFIPL